MFALLVYHCALCTNGPVSHSKDNSQGQFWDNHGSSHGVAQYADASFYMKISNSAALEGGANDGKVVDARSTNGCYDDGKGFGCKK